MTPTDSVVVAIARALRSVAIAIRSFVRELVDHAYLLVCLGLHPLMLNGGLLSVHEFANEHYKDVIFAYAVINLFERVSKIFKKIKYLTE